ncbi:hypothetical protein EVAR_2719_1 [Eumeta japonica]|uniref:Histone-lysine N-methyltransferase SETMAR n=1 Tax=Eumeta variegata TaxID=151549 RepID=A0A4C1SZE0_EUMVA|nr:hypothetical protein EVAR_2719_1 [Eumeta japonica]
MITPDHKSLATQKILREFGREVLMRSPYSPDLVPSDFHLLRTNAIHDHGMCDILIPHRIRFCDPRSGPGRTCVRPSGPGLI